MSGSFQSPVARRRATVSLTQRLPCCEISKLGNNGVMNDDRQRYAIHAAVFAALSNPTRHELMHHLCEAPKTPSELADLLEVSRPNVSQHLAVLQRDGLVKRSRQDGR